MELNFYSTKLQARGIDASCDQTRSALRIYSELIAQLMLMGKTRLLSLRWYVLAATSKQGKYHAEFWLLTGLYVTALIFGSRLGMQVYSCTRVSQGCASLTFSSYVVSVLAFTPNLPLRAFRHAHTYCDIKTVLRSTRKGSTQWQRQQ